jgi:formate dehydrogenase iron-sulfur subunit
MADFAILYDSSRCSACKGCQVACKCWNGLPSPTEKNVQSFTGSYQSPLDLNGDTRLIISFDEAAGDPDTQWNRVRWAFGRRSCQHCSNPACASICPSGALSVNEDTGFVTVTEDKCIGCKYCSTACPFDVPRYHGKQPKINKCTGCPERVANGRAPACVQTCQPGALLFGDREEMLALGKERVAHLQSKGFKDASLYGENELDGLHVITVAKYDLASHGLPANPQINPFVGLVDLAKPVIALAAGATVVGLAASFLTGVGYQQPQLRYDVTTRETIDETTGVVLKVGTSQEGKE